MCNLCMSAFSSFLSNQLRMCLSIKIHLLTPIWVSASSLSTASLNNGNYSDLLLVLNTVTYTNTGGLGDLFEKIARHFYGCFTFRIVITACSNPLEEVYPNPWAQSWARFSVLPGKKHFLRGTWDLRWNRCLLGRTEIPAHLFPWRTGFGHQRFIITTCNVDTRRCFNV